MMSHIQRFIRHFLLAIQFFTRIPVTGRLAAWVGYSRTMLSASAAHFPGVGWVVGAGAALWLWGLVQVLPVQPAAPWVAAIVSTVFSVWLTGAFHEDGLADTADGLGGAVSPERALEIMKDSRIGNYGAAALVLALLTKVSLLVLLVQVGGAWFAAVALFAAHVSSRGMPLWIMYTLHHVDDTAQSKCKPLTESMGLSALLTGWLWWVLAMLLVVWQVPDVHWLWAMLAAFLGLWWMGRMLKRRLGGFTGDGLGATQQVCELMFYLGLVLAC